MKRIHFSLIIIFFGFATLIANYYLVTSKNEELLRTSVTKATQAANATITRIFVNELFPEIDPILKLAERKEGLTGEELTYVDNKVRTFMLGTDILKTKIFNLDGTTLYSTEHKQIGETRRNNTAFQAAAKGGIGSQITTKGKFSAIDEIVFNRDLVSSYIPIRGPRGQIIGVTEIYTDRTGEIALIPAYQKQLITVLLITLLLAAVGFALQFWTMLLTSDTNDSDDDFDR